MAKIGRDESGARQARAGAEDQWQLIQCSRTFGVVAVVTAIPGISYFFRSKWRCHGNYCGTVIPGSELKEEDVRQMMNFRQSRPADANRLYEIWSDAVDATHHFLRPEDRIAIDPEVRVYVASTRLWVAVAENDDPVGFMGLTGGHMDSLFIDPIAHGRGVGRALVARALGSGSTLTVDVNEENEAAIGFYEWVGFRRIGRSPVDDGGRAYPLIHMRLDSADFRHVGICRRR